MKRSRECVGINYFKMIAVISIVFLSVFSSFVSGENEFILIRIIYVTAIPFFFIASGFYLISRYAYNNDRLKKFIKSMGYIYILAMVISLPLNICKGYFLKDYLFVNIIKDIIFDGMVYNLWYFPAAVIGGVISWFLVRKKGIKSAFFITLILYVFGLFLDNYYFIFENISFVKYFYTHIYEISSHIGDGIFYAPIFFVLGGIASRGIDNISLKNKGIALLISFIMLFIEVSLFFKSGVSRCNAMYIFSVPFVYFLFSILSHLKGKPSKMNKAFCDLSILIYIIYPSVIAFLQFIIKSFNLERGIFKSGYVCYIFVIFISIIISLIFVPLLKKMISKNNVHLKHLKDRAWIELNLDNLKHNIKVINEAMQEKCEIMAVVKAGAYGHSMYEISTYINRLGVKAFAVATIEEGIELRRYGITGEILILGYTNPLRAKDIKKYNLTQTLIDYDYAIKLNEQAVNVKTHIKVDTGMHRLGFKKDEIDEILDVFYMENIKVFGIYTHLCVSDSLREEDINFTRKQILRFYQVIEKLKENDIDIPKTHIQGTYGLLNYPKLKCDYVRVGDGIYGVLNSFGVKTKLSLDLRPVLSLKSRVVLIRDVAKGESFGYDRAFVADKDSKIAIIPIGFADGIRRDLSCEKMYALINGCKAMIIGRVCMDQLAVDITDIPDVKLNDVVILIGSDKEESILAAYMAGVFGGITSEVLSGMGDRLKTTVVW